jgi:hypothetical protein
MPRFGACVDLPTAEPGDYAALFDAAHRQLGGAIVLVWDNC